MTVLGLMVLRTLNKKKWEIFSHFFLLCAGHGTNSVGNKPTTGIYRQV